MGEIVAAAPPDSEITPEVTRRPGVDGVAVALGDGRFWTLALAGLDTALDEARDRLFDAAAAFGVYDDDDQTWIRVGAFRLLRMAHGLAVEDAHALVAATPIEALAPAVESALFGGDVGRTYSAWARASLRANGIRPGDLDPAEVKPTLDALESQAKALPRSWITSVKMGQRRRSRGMR